MFTPNGLSVSVRVSRMAARSASGFGCVSAVRMPVCPRVSCGGGVFGGMFAMGDGARTESACV